METAEDKFSFLSQTRIYDLIKNGTFEHIQPDKNNNWLDLTDNDWETMLPIANKETKISKDKKDEKAIFKLFSLGVVTARDEWVYDFDINNLMSKVNFLINTYNSDVEKLKYIEKTAIKDNVNYQIKWSRAIKNDLYRGKKYIFNKNLILKSLYRPYTIENLYYSRELNEMQYQLNNLFDFGFINQLDNKLLTISGTSTSKPFSTLITNTPFCYDLLEKTQCLPQYRYDSKSNRIDNITDWGLEQFHNNYDDKTITKEDIFNYVYAVLHNPEYRKKYEMNLKREFPRIPFYEDFWKWAAWGKKLMDLHINFETVEEYQLKETTIELNKEVYKPKLKADKEAGTIELDNQTILSGIPKEAWEYKLGNRSALEWILDQYKEKKPKDPTIAEKFNTYRFIDYKDKVIDLIKRVTTVSVETVRIVEEMKG
jgi:predicted helicase